MQLTAPQLKIIKETMPHKVFVGHDTSTSLAKRKATLKAEQISNKGGDGLCVYLVGDAKSGLDNHIQDKIKLGFTNLTSHVIVEIVEKTAIELAQTCKDKYPQITVICGDLHKVCSKLGYGSISHLDYDGTLTFGSGHINLTKSAMTNGVSNIHLVGQARKPSEDIQLDDGWINTIKSSIGSISNNYDSDVWTYASSGPTQITDNLRLVSVWTPPPAYKGRGRRPVNPTKTAGWIIVNDLAIINKLLSGTLERKSLSNQTFDLYPRSTNDLERETEINDGKPVGYNNFMTLKFSDVIDMKTWGSPMFMAVLNHENPISRVQPSFNDFIKIPTFDRFYAENDLKLKKIKQLLKIDDEPSPIIQKIQLKGLERPKLDKQIKRYLAPGVKFSRQDFAEIERLGFDPQVNPNQAADLLSRMLKQWPYHPNGLNLRNQIKTLQDKAKTLVNEEEWGPRDYSKEPKSKPVPHQLSWKDWGQYQKDQAIIRQARQDIPKMFGRDEPLPEPDLVEVVEMLAAGEIGVDEAYEVGLSVEEIEDILGRPLTNIELESIEDVDENY